MAEDGNDMVWLFDSVTQFLKGPEWAVPVWDFIDDNCIVFDSEDENKLAYIDIFNAFREMVDSLLGMHLANMGCGAEDFAALCNQYSTTDAGREVLEQILAVDDFVSFKKMMVKRNMELELESLKALQNLSEKLEDEAANGEAPPPEQAEEDDFEAQLQQAQASTTAANFPERLAGAGAAALARRPGAAAAAAAARAAPVVVVVVVVDGGPRH